MECGKRGTVYIYIYISRYIHIYIYDYQVVSGTSSGYIFTIYIYIIVRYVHNGLFSLDFSMPKLL